MLQRTYMAVLKSDSNRCESGSEVFGGCVDFVQAGPTSRERTDDFVHENRSCKTPGIRF